MIREERREKRKCSAGSIVITRKDYGLLQVGEVRGGRPSVFFQVEMRVENLGLKHYQLWPQAANTRCGARPAIWLGSKSGRQSNAPPAGPTHRQAAKTCHVKAVESLCFVSSDNRDEHAILLSLDRMFSSSGSGKKPPLQVGQPLPSYGISPLISWARRWFK